MNLKQLFLAFVTILALMLAGCHKPAVSVSLSPESPLYDALAADHGCSSFCLDNDDHCVFGTNFDNDIHEGLLFVNKRNVSKTGWEANTAGEYARWTSRYGSLTFNLVGYQLVWAGMNEAGLMVSTMALGQSLAPVPDERFPLVGPLWLQYQLDNYSTVEQVLASNAYVRIASPPSRVVDHYLVCDKSGECATIEFLEGKMVYHTGETLPAKALTNTAYEESVQAWQEGDLSDNSLVRFGTAADRATSFEATASEPAIEYAFETLAQVSSSSYTMWSIVFDPQNSQVYFRTKWNDQIRHIDLGELDFACGTPVQMLDVHAPLSGDVSYELGVYSHDLALDHFVNVLGKLGIDSPQSEIKALLQQLESYPCTEDEENGARRVFGSLWFWLVAVAALVIVSATAWYGIRRRVKQN